MYQRTRGGNLCDKIFLDVQKGSVNELSKAFDFVSSLGRAGADDGLISGLSRRH